MKLTRIQREELKEHVIDGAIRRLSLAELKSFVEEKMHGISISTEYLRHLRSDIAKGAKTELDLLRTDRYIYLDELIFSPIRSIKSVQKHLFDILDTSEDEEARIKAAVEIRASAIQLSTYYNQLLRCTTLYTNPNFDVINGSIDNINNNNTSSSSSTVVINNNNHPRWCDRCKLNHQLDEEGKQKCPANKVGMGYENEPGYYEREDFDLERQF